MNLEKHFLPNDIKRASEEYWCVMDLLSMIMKLTNEGNIARAKHLSTDLTKSLHELEQMSSKKYKEDKLHTLVQELAQRGVDVEVVRVRLHER
ncbi:hypothetical protein PD280_06290 [Virgibacillus salarius]|uniref:hypothetical protein n=1 Tax=Virgibacillus salarius TaxID=447199 RepID=UPI002491B1B4|nr:hypothetical protein [Virgibacillus salarius]WBX81327.1 hypothetical protein PD280_06290 [Virgibacillus salarius]